MITVEKYSIASSIINPIHSYNDIKFFSITHQSRFAGLVNSELIGFQIRNKFVEELRKNNLTHEVRANKSGCLGGCSFGPVIVIYPDQIWYKNVKLEDVSEIVNETIINQKILDRLLFK